MAVTGTWVDANLEKPEIDDALRVGCYFYVRGETGNISIRYFDTSDASWWKYDPAIKCLTPNYSFRYWLRLYP